MPFAEHLFGPMTAAMLLGAVAVAFFAGFVKGVVGFALPMIMVSTMGTFVSPEAAIAGMILPALLTNFWQALRDGLGAAADTLSRHWRILVCMVAVICFSSQLVAILSHTALFMLLGCMAMVFCATQLFGLRVSFPPERQGLFQIAAGSLGGFFGGLSGSWGPAVVAYVVSANLPKREAVVLQGVCYLAGSLTLIPAHSVSGVLIPQTALFSAALALPAALGMWAGFKLQDRLNQRVFRNVTLLILLVAGMNLIARGLSQ